VILPKLNGSCDFVDEGVVFTTGHAFRMVISGGGLFVGPVLLGGPASVDRDHLAGHEVSGPGAE
jgi:hypothetical protein